MHFQFPGIPLHLLWSSKSGMMEVEFPKQFTFQKKVGLDSEVLVECVLALKA